MPGPIGIIGPGRLGQAIGKLLRDRGQPVAAIAGRNLSRTAAAARFIGSDVQAVATAQLPSVASRILITVPDAALGVVAQELASAPGSIEAALHTSGARGPEALAPLADRGASTGALHPLQTIASPEQGFADLPGSYFGITADDKALDWAQEICGLLNGHALLIPAERRPLYHAAAAMASNYIVAMIDAALCAFEQSGVPNREAQSALAPLIHTSVTNSLDKGTAAALTGPIERGDAETVAAHLLALRDVPESVQDLYRSAGLHTAALARRKTPGADRHSIEALLKEPLLKQERKP